MVIDRQRAYIDSLRDLFSTGDPPAAMGAAPQLIFLSLLLPVSHMCGVCNSTLAGRLFQPSAHPSIHPFIHLSYPHPRVERATVRSPGGPISVFLLDLIEYGWLSNRSTHTTYQNHSDISALIVMVSCRSLCVFIIAIVFRIMRIVCPRLSC